MYVLKRRRLLSVGGLLAYALIALALSYMHSARAAQSSVAPPAEIAAVFAGPTYSSPIALSNNGGFVWSVNPKAGSVSVIETQTDALVGEIKNLGKEPESIALDPNNRFAYIANAADNSVTIVRINSLSPFNATVEKSFTTGAEPWNVVIAPNGKRVFVANSAQDTITVLSNPDPNSSALPSIVGNIDLSGTACMPDARHFQPRGLAVTADSSKLYVTRFLSFTGGANPKQATDDGKIGLVCRIDLPANTNTLPSSFTPITLASRDAGFANAAGNATAAYPNQMQSVVICGDHAYMPNIAASTSGPLKFNVDTHAFLNRIDGVTGNTQSDGGALNLHLGARGNSPKIFFANVWAMACNDATNPTSAYVVSSGSDGLVKVNIQATGVVTFTGPNVSNQTKFIDLNPNDSAQANTFGRNAGKNPLGIVIKPASGGSAAKAYVMNRVSRNVSVVDLGSDTVSKTINVLNLPAAGSREEQILVGAEMFFSSRGHFDRPAGAIISTDNRLSADGWQNCASCHFEGLTDGNIWTFNSGPRKSIPLNGTWSPHNRGDQFDPADPGDQRILNYSAIFDEVQDFEGNIRNVSGPGFLNPPTNTQFDPNHGLLISDTVGLAGFNAPITALPPLLARAAEGRPQLSVTLPGSTKPWPALDAMKEWVRFAVRTPNGALTRTELTRNGPASNRFGNTSNTGGLSSDDVVAGRKLFIKAGCATCHGGTKWSASTKDFASPVKGGLNNLNGGEVFTEADPNDATTLPNPNAGQYLARFLSDISSYNLNVAGINPPNQLPGQPPIGAVEKDTAGKDGLGIDFDNNGKGAGFNIPSLLGIAQLPPYYHNGACETLACVLSNKTHRTANNTRPDILTSASDQAKVVTFLRSLDQDTVFPTNLYIDAHDVSFNPKPVFSGTQVVVGANISLFGTRADLDTDALQVRFTGPDLDVTVPLPVSAFTKDFSQATVSAVWNVPANVSGNVKVTVQVDSDNRVPEDHEADNFQTVKVFVRTPPADTTPPTVDSVALSDDNPFNADDPITASKNVKVRFSAADPANANPATANGIDSFCIVRYYYDTVRRRWVEQKCSFQPLPAAQGDGSFVVDAQLPAREGVSYAFVYVKDKAGNISKKPGFDFISFVPDTVVNLNADDKRVFRIPVAPGQSVNMTFTPTSGALVVSTFKGTGDDAQFLAVSSGNAPTPVGTVLSVPSNGTATTFQVEVSGIADTNAFTIASQLGTATLQSAPTEAIGPAQSDEPPFDLSAPDQTTVSGPPEETAAIDDDATDVMLPIVVK